ncbi:unnamed protein product [Phytomonas sp. Hart1]|nr:unnamed protein product [Phytomonas sp. Hart1]|eukprot:CCW67195.1 unnamed protein product [Phytomonas sp. isolate Hart1]
MHLTQDASSVRSNVHTDSVRVYCRVQPFRRSEGVNSEISPCCVHLNDKDTENGTIMWSVPSPNIEFTSPRTPGLKFSCGKNTNSDSSAQHLFHFSGVFRQISGQKEVYDSVVQPVLADVMEGYNGNIFVYGQTGSGKTYTMFGKTSLNGQIFCDNDTTDRNVVPIGVGCGVKREDWFPNKEESLILREETNLITPRRLAKPKSIETKANTGLFPFPHKCIPPIVKGDQKPVECFFNACCENSMAHGKQDTLLSTTWPSYLVPLHTSGESPKHCTHNFELGDVTGIVPRAVNDLFHLIEHADVGIEFEVRLSFVEIYMEQVIDLLASTSSWVLNPNQPQDFQSGSRHLQVREDANSSSFYIEGCAIPKVTCFQDAMSLIQTGMRRRTTAATNMNDASSRSHCLLNFIVRRFDRDSNELKVGKLFLVDLAGSEKVSRTKSEGIVLEEAKLINKSLLTLSLVIQALNENANHVPFRNSVLTKLLKDSLGGNFRTALVVCCSPDLCNADETLSTLRFGARAKTIQNHAIVNREPIPEELKRMLKSAQEEIRRLRTKLRQQRPSHQETDDAECIHKGAVIETTSARRIGMKSTSQQQRVPFLTKKGVFSSEGSSLHTSFLDDDNDSNSSFASIRKYSHRKAQKQIRLSEQQIELNEARDTLCKVQEINVLMTERGNSQRAKIASLEEENRTWEEECAALCQHYNEQEELLAITKSHVTLLSEEVFTLTEKIEENLDSVRRSCEMLENSSVHACASSQQHPILENIEESQINIEAGLNSVSCTFPFKSPRIVSLPSLPMTIDRDSDKSPVSSVHMLNRHDKSVATSDFFELGSPQTLSSMANMVVRPLVTAFGAQPSKDSHSFKDGGWKERHSLQTSGELVSFTLRLLDEMGSPFHSVLAHQVGLGNSKSTLYHHQSQVLSSTIHYPDQRQYDPFLVLNNIKDSNTDAVPQRNSTTYENSELLNEAVLCILELGRRIQDMDQNLAKEAQSRNSVALKLELAEKKLKIRQERIEVLNLGMQQESKSSQELRMILEKERNAHQKFVDVAHRDANYWRRRYEELDEQSQRPHKQQKT